MHDLPMYVDQRLQVALLYLGYWRLSSLGGDLLMEPRDKVGLRFKFLVEDVGLPYEKIKTCWVRPSMQGTKGAY
jgi:hypothetical protein